MAFTRHWMPKYHQDHLNSRVLTTFSKTQRFRSQQFQDRQPYPPSWSSPLRSSPPYRTLHRRDHMKNSSRDQCTPLVNATGAKHGVKTDGRNSWFASSVSVERKSRTLSVIAVIGCYQEGIAKTKIGELERDVTAHI